MFSLQKHSGKRVIVKLNEPVTDKTKAIITKALSVFHARWNSGSSGWVAPEDVKDYLPSTLEYLNRQFGNKHSPSKRPSSSSKKHPLSSDEESPVEDKHSEEQRAKRFYSSFEKGIHKKPVEHKKLRSHDSDHSELSEASSPDRRRYNPPTPAAPKKPEKRHRVLLSESEEEEPPAKRARHAEPKKLKRSAGYLDRIRQISKG